MRSVLSALRAGLRYGAWIIVIVDILEYAVGKIEEQNEKTPLQKKADENISEQS